MLGGTDGRNKHTRLEREECKTHGSQWCTAFSLGRCWEGPSLAFDWALNLFPRSIFLVHFSPWPFIHFLGFPFPLYFLATCKRAVRNSLSLGDEHVSQPASSCRRCGALGFKSPTINTSFSPDCWSSGQCNSQKCNQFHFTSSSSTCQQTHPQFIWRCILSLDFIAVTLSLSGVCGKAATSLFLSGATWSN